MKNQKQIKNNSIKILWIIKLQTLHYPNGVEKRFL